MNSCALLQTKYNLLHGCCRAIDNDAMGFNSNFDGVPLFGASKTIVTLELCAQHSAAIIVCPLMLLRDHTAPQVYA